MEMRRFHWRGYGSLFCRAFWMANKPPTPVKDGLDITTEHLAAMAQQHQQWQYAIRVTIFGKGDGAAKEHGLDMTETQTGCHNSDMSITRQPHPKAHAGLLSRSRVILYRFLNCNLFRQGCRLKSVPSSVFRTGNSDHSLIQYMGKT